LEEVLRRCRRHRKRLGQAITLERLEGGGCCSWRGCECSGAGVAAGVKGGKKHGGLCLCTGNEEMEMGKMLPDWRSIDCCAAKRPDGKETGVEQNAAHDDLRAAAAIWNSGRMSSSSQGARGRCRSCRVCSGGGMAPLL